MVNLTNTLREYQELQEQNSLDHKKSEAYRISKGMQERNEKFSDSHNLNEELIEYIEEQGFERLAHVPWRQDIFRTMQRHLEGNPSWRREDGYVITSQDGIPTYLIKTRDIEDPSCLTHGPFPSFNFNTREMSGRLTIYAIHSPMVGAGVGYAFGGAVGAVYGGLFGPMIGILGAFINPLFRRRRSKKESISSRLHMEDYRFAKELIETIGRPQE